MAISNNATGYRPGVCTFDTRPTSPYEGQMVYEIDTDMVALWNGTAWRYIAATTPTNGTVLQVVQGSTSTQKANNTNVFDDTGLSASITPKSASSKVLVLVTQNGAGKASGNAGSAIQLRLMRGSTEIVVFEGLGGYTNTTTANVAGSYSTVYLDSPSTTSSTTYKTQFRNVTNAAGVEVQNGGGGLSTVSTITLMEIAG